MIDVGVLYDILRDVARNYRPFHYSDLSAEYHKRTGEWYEPHGSWDGPLGEINVLAHRHRPPLPPISAVVTLKPDQPGGQSEPGGLFWGSAPGIPSRPRSREDRFLKWVSILQTVQKADWPPSLS